MDRLSASSASTLQWSIAVVMQQRPEQMERTLLSVLENLPPGGEVLLVLDGPYEDPYELEGEVRFVRAGEGASWSQCANAALGAAQGEWLQLLPSGMLARPGWCQWYGDLPQQELPGVVIPGLGCSGPRRAAACQSQEAELPLEPWRPGRLSAALASLGAEGSGFFFHRPSVEAAGGWRLGLSGPWADVELAHRLLQRGCTLAVAADCQVELAASGSGVGPWRRGWNQRRLALLVGPGWQAAVAAIGGVPRLLYRLLRAPGAAGTTLAEALGGLGAWITYPVLRPQLPQGMAVRGKACLQNRQEPPKEPLPVPMRRAA